MKKTFLLSLVMLAFTALNAQTVDEILTKYFENTGGLEKWQALQTMKMSGKMAMGPMEFPGTVFSKQPNKQRVNVNVQGKDIVQAYDGETAWWINPFAGGEEAQPMPDEMAEQMKKEEFESPFLNYQEKGNAVELLGTKEVEGTQTFEVKLTKKNGDVQTYYFDQEYFVPIMMKMPIQTGPAKGQESETYFSDYQEVDGMMFPFFIETKIGGESAQKIIIESITLNEELEDGFFAYPKK